MLHATTITRFNQVASLLALTWVSAAWAKVPVAAHAGRPVSLYVTVEQKKGGPFQGLSAGDLRLYEDGKPRKFRLEPIDGPTSVAVLLENSQRSWGIFYNDIQSAVQDFLDTAPQGNWYALATFNHDVKVKVDFTKDLGRLSAAFADLSQPIWDEADTYDAIYEMLDRMERLPGRRVLVFIGSGLDSYSAHSYTGVEAKIESANVLFYGLGAGSALRGEFEPYLGELQRMNLLQAQSFLGSLADKSGGQAWFPLEEGAYRDAMKGIMRDLSDQYRLVYDSRAPADGKLHKVKVEALAASEDLQVRVRQGWRRY